MRSVDKPIGALKQTSVDTPHEIEGVLEFIKLSYEDFLNNSQNVSELRKDIFKGLLVTLFPVS